MRRSPAEQKSSLRLLGAPNQTKEAAAFGRPTVSTPDMSSRRGDGFRGSPSRRPPGPVEGPLEVEDISLDEDDAGGGVITEVRF